MAHFAVIVIGSDAQKALGRFGIYREGSKEEHEDGQFDWAQEGGMFKQALVLHAPVPRKRLFGFIPMGVCARSFQATLKDVDIEQTAATNTPFVALVSGGKWVDLPGDDDSKRKEALLGLLRQTASNELLTVFDCHA